ncbi:MAG TPA: helix-turn-helix domain-containing protein [Chthoniobacterales bacterium]|nr:helix-turn-helix domain-containing protein [Chthoniobacterales bacterium]
MEGLGKKLRDARLARNLTLDEAGRMTKIRPGRLEEIENEDFSQFASLAYAKGFLLIYGKFLEVDVSPYLEAFENSESVTVDGYAYLQDNPEPPPSRPMTTRRTRSSSSGGGGGGGRSSFAPFLIGVVVLIIGFIAIRSILELQRLKPRPPNTPAASPSASQTKVVAPRALPAENATPPAVAATTAPPVQPTIAVTTPAPTPAASEPEVRRAEAVHPDDLAKAQTNASPSPSGPIKVEVRALKKTYVKVIVDDDEASALERWITPTDGTVQFRGTHIAVKVLDATAVEIKKNGKRITKGDADVTID